MKHVNVFTRDEVVRVNEIMIGKSGTKAEPLRTAKFMPARLTRDEINKAYAEVRRVLAAKS